MRTALNLIEKPAFRVPTQIPYGQCGRPHLTPPPWPDIDANQHDVPLPSLGIDPSEHSRLQDLRSIAQSFAAAVAAPATRAASEHAKIVLQFPHCNWRRKDERGQSHNESS
jgi:hypothetical protein